MVANRPDWALYVAYDAAPNSDDIPTWTDETVRLMHADSIRRGRQYELDQNQASQPTLSLWDVDEYLNPANTAAPDPYSGHIVPYRQILFQGGWPNPVTGNLINTAAQGNPDPTFESDTTDTTPGWVSAVGGTSPVVADART